MNETTSRTALLACVLVAAILVLAARLGGCSWQTCHANFRVRKPPPAPDTYAVPLGGGVTRIEYRDKIPKDKQVGCHVCPYLCTQIDLSPAPMDELIPYYVYQVNRYFEQDMPEDTLEQLDRMSCMAAISEPAERERFLELLHHSNPRVRYAAAVHAVRMDLAVDRALATLRALTALTADPDDVSGHARDQLLNVEEGKRIDL